MASDTTDISDTTDHLGVLLILSGAGAALLAALIAAALSSRGLTPLRRLAAGAGEIERTADPSLRLPHAASADEIGQLTGVLNRMLASLQRSRENERRYDTPPGLDAMLCSIYQAQSGCSVPAGEVSPIPRQDPGAIEVAGPQAGSTGHGDREPVAHPGEFL